MKLKLFILLSLVISIHFPLYGYKLVPENEMDQKVDDYFFESMKHAKNANYLEALTITKKIVELLPNHPAGYLFTSAVLSWIISDFYNYEYADDFLEYIDKTIDLSEDMIQESRLDPWGYIYLGGAYGFRGIYYSLIGSFYYAFVDGVRGNYQIQKALKLNDQIYDSHFGTGTFDFWKAYYSGKFFWLGTTDKNKQKGIDKILIAINKGKYTTLEANFSLVRIYMVDERYQDAIDKGNELLINSPGAVKVRRFLGRSYYATEEYDKALESFIALKELTEKNPLKTPASLLGINIDIARVYLKMKRVNDAMDLLNKSQAIKKQIESNNDFIENLLADYEQLVEEVKNKLSVES